MMMAVNKARFFSPTNEYILLCVLDMSDTLIFYHLFALEVSGVKRRIAFRKGKGKKFVNLRFVCSKVVRYHSGPYYHLQLD